MSAPTANEPPWEDTGQCRIVGWLETGGTPGGLYMGDNNQPLHSGPIETEWDGDCYRWQYAHTEATEPETHGTDGQR